ncbi:MAG: hypothetical protein ACRENP_17610 [Longimicrobiales bacterium]
MYRSLARPALTVLGLSVLTIVSGFGMSAGAQTQGAAAERPMTFLDMQLTKQAGSVAPSPDRKWLLYMISKPDWKEARRQTDIYLVSLEQGLSSTRQ